MGFWLLILVLCHATNSIESINSPRNNAKLYKIFDEIFGEGWDNEEEPKLLEPAESQRMEASSTENRNKNSHHNEQGGRNGSEESAVQTEHNELDGFDEGQEAADELFDSNDQNNQKNSENHKNKENYSDDQKREIVQEYIKLKRRYCQKRKVSKKEWNQFNANAAKHLGVRYNTICIWQKQFFGVNIKNYTDEQKQEKLKEYYEIKLRNPKIKDMDIATDLEIPIRTLFKWKAQFKHSPDLNMPAPSSTKSYSDVRKREIVQEYIALKNKFAQQKKHSKNEWNQFYANISMEFGVTSKTIFKWMKQFGINMKKYTDDRKREIVQEFIELKNKFMQEKKHSHNEWNQFYANISMELGVSHGTVFKWKKQFFGINISNEPPFLLQNKETSN